jgi:O-antigen ligase
MISVAFFLFLKMAKKGNLGGLMPAAPLLAAVVLSFVASLVLASQDSALYGVLMVAVVLAARTFIATIGLGAVISCYFQASIISVIILVATTAGELAAFRFSGERFAPFEFHPNLLAFIFATYVPIQWWAPLQSRRTRNFARAFAIVSGMLLTLTISRGSVVAVLCGILAVLLTRFVPRVISGRLQFSRRAVVFACFGAFLLIGTVYTQKTIVSDAYTSVYSVFELDSKYRGLQTGLTGRTDVWRDALDMLSDGSWLTGNGYRTGGERVGASVDNGYLTALFELGFFAAAFVILRYLYALYVCGQQVAKVHEPVQASWSTALFVFLMIFLVNNIVARYLFGYGNPASLLGLFLLTTTGDEIKGLNSLDRGREHELFAAGVRLGSLRA